MRKTTCAGCGAYFSSTTEFDAHRTGDFGRTPSHRRCMAPAEMLAAGFTSEPCCITDEPGRPTRPVWSRSSRLAPRGFGRSDPSNEVLPVRCLKVPETHDAQAAIGIVASPAVQEVTNTPNRLTKFRQKETP